MKKTWIVSVVLLLQASFLPCQSAPTGSLFWTGSGQGQAVPAQGTEKREADLRIRFWFTAAVSQTPISGRIIVGFQRDLAKPINNPDLFDPQPTFAWEVSDWKPGESLVLDGSNAVRWQGDLNSLEGWYGVQAVLKIKAMGRTAESPGNGLTAKNVVFIEKGKMGRPLDLLFAQSMPGQKEFEEKEFIKEARIASPLLTEFYGQPQFLQAAVILPPSYFTDPARTYPSVYVFGGWGATHYDALTVRPQERYGMSGIGEEKVFVFVNHECRSGYHVFCSSETNGPREETFFQELLPSIEKQYRVDKDPRMRFLMGQSSGAWGALWLLLNYPDRFGGAYVGSPDPVDFTDFTGTNIYEKNANMHVDAQGKTKYVAGTISMADLVALDRIAGWGEQMYSFDATFSRRDRDGEPRRLFDWDTGAIDPEVAAVWGKHDLSRVAAKLDREKTELLQGKIHIYVNEDDPFGLNRPVHTFRQVLLKKGLKADISFMPSGGHSVWTDEVRKRIHGDIDAKTLIIKKAPAENMRLH